jgi:hypothetical protein
MTLLYSKELSSSFLDLLFAWNIKHNFGIVRLSTRCSWHLTFTRFDISQYFPYFPCLLSHVPCPGHNESTCRRLFRRRSVASGAQTWWRCAETLTVSGRPPLRTFPYHESSLARLAVVGFPSGKLSHNYGKPPCLPEGMLDLLQLGVDWIQLPWSFMSNCDPWGSNPTASIPLGFICDHAFACPPTHIQDDMHRECCECNSMQFNAMQCNVMREQ